MTTSDVIKMLIEETPYGIKPRMNGFARYIGKSGGILVRAFGEADSIRQSLILKKFPDLEIMWKMCCNNIKTDFCRVVMGAYLLGLTPVEIEEGCREIDIWKEELT